MQWKHCGSMTDTREQETREKPCETQWTHCSTITETCGRAGKTMANAEATLRGSISGRGGSTGDTICKAQR